VSAFLALTSIVLAMVVGGLVSRLAYKWLAFGAAANPVPGLLLVGVCLLGSGYVYRRRFFTTSLDCAIGVFAYAMTVILLAVDITGMDAITGMIDGWVIWLVLAPLAPWFGGFFVANYAGFRSKGRT